MLCLNVGDASRAETYYAQKLLQYREAVDKIRDNPDAPSSELLLTRHRISASDC